MKNAPYVSKAQARFVSLGFACLILLLVGVVVMRSIVTELLFRQQIPIFVFSHSFNPRSPSYSEGKSEMARFLEGILVVHNSPHRETAGRIPQLDPLYLVVR